MIGSLDPSAERFLSAINGINQRAQRAQRRLSSGKKLNSASDAPDSVGQLLAARASFDQNQQIRSNLVRLKAETDSAEQSLSRAVLLLDRAIVLAAQGATGTASPDTRAAAAGEVAGILEQLVGISQVRVENRYIFAGDSDQQIPYTYDATQPYPVSAYAGAASTRKAQHPSGILFTTSRTADAIFDSVTPGENVFQNIRALQLALENNDEVAIGTAMHGLRSAHVHLNRQLAFYGIVQNKLEDATNNASSMHLLLKSQLSDIEDADPALEVLELQQASLQLDAALASRAQLPRKSLFDFIG